MKRSARLAALMLSLAAAASGEKGGGINDLPGGPPSVPGSNTQRKDPVESPPARPADEDVPVRAEDAPPLTEADIKTNFVSVVETYIRQNSPDGFWPMKDSRNGKWFKVKLRSVDKGSVVGAEGGLYKGRAAVTGLTGKPELTVDFTVDFSGLWAVKKYEVAADEDSQEAAEGSLSPAAFSALIKRHVKALSRKTGAYAVRDKELRKTWKLKLAEVHSDDLTQLPDERFFGPAVFTEAGGRASLELDFYVRQKGTGWAVDEVLIREVDGKPRYEYDETNQRVPPAP